MAGLSPQRLWRRAWQLWLHPREESGAVLIVVALSMVMIIGAVSLSLDIGQQVDRSRNMQDVADAVALDTAQFLPGDTAVEYLSNRDPSGGTPWTAVQTELVSSATRNGFQIAGNGGPPTNFMTLTAGVFDPKTTPTFTPVVSTDPTITDQAGPTQIVNAVQVTVSSNQQFSFATGNRQVARVATAMRAIPDSACLGCAPAVPTSAISGFSIGSFLANANTQDSVLNSLLGPLGTNLSLQVVSYQGLASTDITLADLVAADAQLGTVDHLLSTKFPPGTLLSGVGSAIGQKIAQLTSSGSPVPTGLAQAQSDINSIAMGITSGTPISMCQLLDPSGVGANCAPNEPPTLGNMNLLQLVTGIIELADGNNAIDLGGSVPGLLGLKLSAIQPPQMALPGPINVTKAHTGQVTLDATLGLPDLLIADVKVTSAAASGTLTAISCTTPVDNSSTTIHVDTQGVNLGLSVSLAGIVVVTDTGSVLDTHQDLNFLGPGLPGGHAFDDTNAKTTNDSNLGINWGNPTVLGLLPLPVGDILNLVGSSLLPDLQPVLAALGMSLAGATVVNNYLNCGVPVLVRGA
ncbi:MAG: hypothetical protein ACYCS7_09360 [Acidimicrobiales bacterium]